MSKAPIVHIEIPAEDPHQAGEFYGELFGWDIDYDEQMDYVQFLSQEGLGGGMPEVGEMAQAGDVILYIQSEDIEGDLEKIQAKGGKTVVPKTEIPTVGFFALFSDPTGNTLGLFSGPEG